MRKMKIGIDNYAYHRFMGEVYPEQSAPSKTMTMKDYLDRANELGVDGVSLESCFFPEFGKNYLAELKGKLDEYNLDRVFAWGHPDGLEGGKNKQAFDEMMEMMDYAVAIGAKVMRVVGSSLGFRFENHQEQIDRLTGMFIEAMKEADKRGLKLADENHIDFTADEMLQLINNVNNPNFGINLDTGNFMRLLDDPVKGAKKLAKHVMATHVKDLKPEKGLDVDNWHFFACTPVGDGLVDNQQLAQILYDNGFDGFLAVEIDYLHKDYNNDEDAAVAQSIKELDRIASNVKG
ncbi:MAG: sugar phosphate isomerase/epimerase [Spirochaetales bacterium]|nr:sugar phosphate isomerase/epimerase [Spirochaetales bacterium]MCF7939130.1 sugar phosphate isomerase/epimerase [Spirochaetales bacterium]